MDTKIEPGDRVTSDLHPGVLGVVHRVNDVGDAYVEWRAAGTHAAAWCDASLLTVWRRAEQEAVR